ERQSGGSGTAIAWSDTAPVTGEASFEQAPTPEIIGIATIARIETMRIAPRTSSAPRRRLDRRGALRRCVRVDRPRERAREGPRSARPARGGVSAVPGADRVRVVVLRAARAERRRTARELPARIVERAPHLVLDVLGVRAVVAPELPEGERVGEPLHGLRQAR